MEAATSLKDTSRFYSVPTQEFGIQGIYNQLKTSSTQLAKHTKCIVTIVGRCLLESCYGITQIPRAISVCEKIGDYQARNELLTGFGLTVASAITAGACYLLPTHSTNLASSLGKISLLVSPLLLGCSGLISSFIVSETDAAEICKKITDRKIALFIFPKSPLKRSGLMGEIEEQIEQNMLKLSHYHIKIFKKLSDKYDIVFERIDSIKEITPILEKLRESKRKIELLHITCHGNPTSLAWRNEVVKGYSHGLFSGMDQINYDFLEPQATIVLHSCKTGAQPISGGPSLAEWTQLWAGPEKRVIASKYFVHGLGSSLEDHEKLQFKFDTFSDSTVIPQWTESYQKAKKYLLQQKEDAKKLTQSLTLHLNNINLTNSPYAPRSTFRLSQSPNVSLGT